ncbi:hypothetical protein KJN74_02160 [Candidatus Bathyarchaeota archaeon]|nr:hypothetical protein [Candidatus Bathyarchaeota archaeon]
MVTKIKCKKCNEALSEFDDVPNNVIWYSHLRHKLRGVCPKCGHKFPKPSKYAKKIRIEIKPIVSVIPK